jgi:hypothetical protein
MQKSRAMFRLLAKRQTGVLQDASRILGINVSRAASWTTVPMYRDCFSQRHIKLGQC